MQKSINKLNKTFDDKTKTKIEETQQVTGQTFSSSAPRDDKVITFEELRTWVEVERDGREWKEEKRMEGEMLEVGRQIEENATQSANTATTGMRTVNFETAMERNCFCSKVVATNSEYCPSEVCLSLG